MSGLLQVLEACPERLPEEVLLIPEKLLAQRIGQDSYTPNRADLYFKRISALVIRLYQQSRAHKHGTDAHLFESRCLNLVDAALLTGRGVMDSEMIKMDQ